MLFSWWRKRLGQQIKVVMMTRAGCGCCEVAWKMLTEEQSRWGYQLTSVPIDDDEALTAKHGDKVPVVLINDRVRFWGRINRVLFRRALTAESVKNQDF